MGKTLVSVVMPAYNAARYLREAIDSILAQTFTDFELIIINDGSTDNTKEIIQSYSDPRIIYIENEENSGICVTLNKGLDAARGKYIARMDSDDIAMPERLAIQVEYLESHPEIGVVGADIEIFYNDKGYNSKIFKFDTDPRICKANLIFSATLAHPTAVIRTSVLKDHNLRYDDYFRGMEDHHLWWQIAKHTGISNLSQVLLRYRQHSSQVTKQSVSDDFRNRLRWFILQRVYDCGAVLSTDEMDAFCLYHENVCLYDSKLLSNFISACCKILKSLKYKRAEHYSAQKMVFSRAISFCLDKSQFNRRAHLGFQTLALFKGSMNLVWYTKRITLLFSKLPPPQDGCENEVRIQFKEKKRIAILMYYMNCGGVEAALVSMLDKIDYDNFHVDLYLLQAKGEFLRRINRHVHIVDLSVIINSVLNKLIVSQNIHETVRYAIENSDYSRAALVAIRYTVFKLSRSEFPAYKAALSRNNIAKFTYDSIWDFHGYASFTTYLGDAILSGKKKYTWCHSQSIVFEKAVKHLNRYDKMFTVSAEMKSLPSLKCLKIPVEVFYNFIDIDRILAKAAVGTKCPIGLDACMNLLTIGRLSLQKGYDRAVEVAKILKKRGLKFKWYFCGDGEEKNNILSLIKKYQLEDHIILLGFQDNPYGYLSTCDIYIQPSRWEGYAVTLMEAKVLHKVVVTTNVSGAGENICHGHDGFICSHDFAEIALRIESLMTDSRLLDKMRRNAAESKFSQDFSELQLNSILG